MADEAKKRRSAAKAQFTRAEKAVQTALGLERECPTWTLEKRYDDLKKRWDNVQDAHDTYVLHSAGEEVDESEENWIDELAVRFDKTELEVGAHIKQVKSESEVKIVSPQTDPVKEAGGASTARNRIIKIEPIKFQSFSGDIRKYPLFKAEFKKHVVPLCGKDQEIIVLKSYLSDAIKEEVVSVGDDPTEVWRRLDNKYGRVDKIVEKVLSEIKSLPKSNNTENVLKMVGIIERAHIDLKNLHMESEMQNSSVISDIEGAMSPQMRYEWVKLIASQHLDSVRKFGMLLLFLGEWRERLEYDDAAVRAGNKPGAQSFHTSQQTGVQSPHTSQQRTPWGGRKDCWLHNSPEYMHPIWNCKLFLGKSVGERMSLVEANKACKRCLDNDCPGASDIEMCPRLFTCSIQGCGGKHNKLLHLVSNTLHADMSTVSSTDAALPIQVVPGRR